MTTFQDMINRGRELGYANIRSWPVTDTPTDVTDLVYEQTLEAIELSELNELVRDPTWVAGLLAEKPELFDIEPIGLMPHDVTLAGMLRSAVAKMVIIEIETDLLIECHKCGHLNDAGLSEWLEAVRNSRELFERNHISRPQEPAAGLIRR